MACDTLPSSAGSIQKQGDIPLKKTGVCADFKPFLILSLQLYWFYLKIHSLDRLDSRLRGNDGVEAVSCCKPENSNQKIRMTALNFGGRLP